MSYMIGFAEERTIGQIIEAVDNSPEWKHELVDSGELCINKIGEDGHFIFGFVDGSNLSAEVFEAGCYACPDEDSLKELLGIDVYDLEEC